MLRQIGTAGLSVAMLLSGAACTGTATGQDVLPASGEVITQHGVTTWPLRLDTASGQLAIYEPQPETFTGNTLTARAAVSLLQAGATDPVFGAMWMQARVATDQDARTVTILDVQVKKVRFPQSDDAQQAQYASVIEQQIPQMAVTFSLDDLSATLQVAQQEKINVGQLQTAPPKILYSSVPSTLVVIDGAPQLQPVDQTQVMRVVNTPFILLLDMPSKQYFLKAGDTWFVAHDATGPYQSAGNAPANIADVASKLSGPPPAAADPNATAPKDLQPRQIIVATEPTELVSTNGAPSYTPLPGNDLLFVSNTLSDVFMDVGTQQTYVLLAGRWYRTRSLQQGPWEYVGSDQLPQSFASIPADSPKAHCLASIAGTQAASDARMDAAIPQTAAISRTTAPTFNIAYDGAPKFESIQETPTVSYAVNTPESVLLVQNRYYVCHQAVWYDGPAAAGPWVVCSSVPQVIYTIPPSCPVYNVRYVYVYDSTPDVVYCGYLPGYCGTYVYGPTVVYGTGYYYRGWYGNSYYGRPWTYGCGVRYSPEVHTWGYGASYGWDRRWMAQDHIDREHGAFGPRGYVNYRTLPRGGNRTVVNNVNVDRSVNVNRTVNNTYVTNIYNRTQNVQRNVTVNRNTNITRNQTNVRDTNVARPNNAGQRPASTYENNVYAGHDGQVYRKTTAGWEQRDAKGWNKIDTVPEAKAAERAAAAKEAAANANRNAGDRRDISVPTPAERNTAAQAKVAAERNAAARDNAAAAKERETAAKDNAAAARANNAAQQQQREADAQAQRNAANEKRDAQKDAQGARQAQAQREAAAQRQANVDRRAAASGLDADVAARQRTIQQRNAANADRNAGDRRDISAPAPRGGAPAGAGRDGGNGRDPNGRGK